MVAVAVVSHETRELLAACLEALRGEADQVIVVDNASADGSAAMVRERFPEVTLVASAENLGFGPAVNLAARRTAAPWLVPMNADVEVRPGALAALVAAGERHPRAGVLAPKLVTPDGAWQHSVHPFPTLPVAAAFHLAPRRALGRRLAFEGHVDPDAPRAVDWAHGALLLVRRSAWEAAGGFDPGQWLYAEDLDLCWRVRRAGFTVRYEPSAVAVHHVSAATAQAFGEARHARAQAAAYAWMRRRRGPARTRAYAGLSWASASVRARLTGGWRRDRLREYARWHREGWRAAR
ncbi:MAG: glycosyltransferase family 2 protein [Solirubrobacterales bacterium]|nr:glycosyltransferase family 2 protein [Solirubrobacterales bacterium]